MKLGHFHQFWLNEPITGSQFPDYYHEPLLYFTFENYYACSFIYEGYWRQGMKTQLKQHILILIILYYVIKLELIKPLP